MLQNFSHATSHQEAYENSVSNSITRQCVRVVKEPDLKSGGLCPRRFESCRWRASIVQWLEYLPSKQVARVRFPVDASAISLVAMIPRCQRGGPSSILGWRTFLSLKKFRSSRTLLQQNMFLKMTGVGFEPTPPERLVPKTSALDHSANQSLSFIELIRILKLSMGD